MRRPIRLISNWLLFQNQFFTLKLWRMEMKFIHIWFISITHDTVAFCDGMNEIRYSEGITTYLIFKKMYDP